MPIWISFCRVNTCNGKIKASAFLSWTSPVLYPGPCCLQWKGQGWQHLWRGPDDSWRTFGHTTFGHQPFLGRQRWTRTMVARTIDLAHVPTVHLNRHSQKGAEVPFAWISFAKQGQKQEAPSYYSLFFNLIPKTCPSQGHRGMRSL